MRQQLSCIVVACCATTAAASPALIGTAHPVMVKQIADDGSWLVACEARRDTDGDGKIRVSYGFHGRTYGDDLEPYLIIGSGPGTRIDAFVSQSDDGRWVAVIRGGKLVLIDTTAHTELVVSGADTRDDGDPYSVARAANISGDGTRMTYFRSDRLVIRELATGRERSVELGGVPWHAVVDDAGHLARVDVLPTGSRFNGASTSLAERECRGPELSFIAEDYIGATATTRWLDLDTGTFVASVEKVVEDSFDDPQPHHAEHPLPRVSCDHDDRCEDDETGKPLVHPAGTVEYDYDDRIVIHTSSGYVVYAIGMNTTTALPSTGTITHAGDSTVTIGQDIFDLYTAKRIGSSREVVVVSVGKRVLLGHAPPPCKPSAFPDVCVDGGTQQLATGPLRWAP
jgi:hypothetical protein